MTAVKQIDIEAIFHRYATGKLERDKPRPQVGEWQAANTGFTRFDDSLPEVYDRAINISKARMETTRGRA